MKSFNQELKNEIVAEIIKHREADQIIQGVYWDEKGQKGCAVGCAIHSLNIRKGKNLSTSDHSAYEREFGIPAILARLEDKIFEGLSVEDSKTWPENFMSAIPADTDLSLVWPKFAVWLLTGEELEVIKYAKNKEVIQKVSDLYTKVINGVAVSKDEWRLAHRNAADADADADADAAAYAAAYAAADAAAYAYADAAAYAYAAAAADAAAYAYAAAYAAAYAYAAAAYAYAYADARKSSFKKMANKLIDILKTDTATV